MATWWKRLFKKGELERQLDKELRFHFEQQVADLIRKGLPEPEARRRARLEFGGWEQVKEECRDSRGIRWLENTIADIRFAARNIGKSPGYAIVAIVTLGVGIGGNIAMFSVLNAVFLRPLPYPHPEQLVWATEYYPKFKRSQMFAPEYTAWHQQNTTFDRLEAYGISIGMNLARENDSARRIQVSHVTPGYFAALGITPRMGRAFYTGDRHAERDRVVIFSYTLWRNYFQADHAILQKTIVLDGAPYTVVGVMPAGFPDLAAADTEAWLPDAVDEKRSMPARSMSYLGGVIGRLKPGVTVEQARANLDIIARRMDREYPTPWSAYHAAASVHVAPLQSRLTTSSKRALFLLMGVAAFVLLIVCANLANLFLSRSVIRRREIAIRLAIGASRFRIIRLLLLESLLVSFCGGVAGITITRASLSALSSLVPALLPRDIPVDAAVFCFAALCSTAAGVLFGMAPAFQASRLDLNASLKDASGQPTSSRRFLSFRAISTVVQLALSIVLLAGAGLLLRSLLVLLSVNPGFNSHQVLLAEMSLAPQDRYSPARQAEFFRRALEGVRRLPGVAHAAVTSQGPLATFQSLASGLSAEGQPASDATVAPVSVSPDYFRALQIPLLSGRDFTDRDRSGSSRVAILNQALAQILFPGQNAVGRRIRFGEEPDSWVTVIGVVGNIRHRGLDDKIWPELYQPYEQAPSSWMTLAMKTSGNPSQLVSPVRELIASIDHTQAVFGIESLDERLSDSLRQRRQKLFLFGLFGVVALVVASTGVYGVVAYSAAQRTKEIGVRMALGAQAFAVIKTIAAEAFRTVIFGIMLGALAASVFTRLLSGFLYGVKPTDSVAFTSACIVLASAALIAALIPAYRAAKLDPVVTLRQE